MNDSVLHHEIDLSGHSDVVDGVPRHRDDVGEFIWVSAPRPAHPSSSAATLVAVSRTCQGVRNPVEHIAALISEVPVIDINAPLTAAHATAPSTLVGADPTLSSISTPVPTQGDAPNAC